MKKNILFIFLAFLCACTTTMPRISIIGYKSSDGIYGEPKFEPTGTYFDYIEKNQSFEPDKEYTTKIYVDENDDSHSLEIRQYKYSSSAKRLVVLIVITPYFAVFFETRQEP